MNNNEIERYGMCLPEVKKICNGYKETEIIRLSARTTWLSNNDIPISENIAVALNAIAQLMHNAEVDRIMDGYTQKSRESRNENDYNRVSTETVASLRSKSGAC
ncbi:MAG: hypothetical protein NC320_00920 [Clostridium sp.]|nr:hypothetical protein [Clostridium sp.]